MKMNLACNACYNLISYLIICPFSFNLFMNLSLPFHMTTPIRHVEVTDHMTYPFLPLYNLGSSLELPYWQFSMSY